MPLRVGVCTPREIHHFFDQVRDGILAEARRFESVGVSIDYDLTPRLGAEEYEGVNGNVKLSITWRFEEETAWLEPIKYEPSAGDHVVALHYVAEGTGESGQIARVFSGHVFLDFRG